MRFYAHECRSVTVRWAFALRVFILSHGGDRYFNAGGKFKFLRDLKHHYTYYTREWYSPRGRPGLS